MSWEKYLFRPSAHLFFIFYFFIFGCTIFIFLAVCELFSSFSECGLLSSCSMRSSHWVASLVAEQGL